MFLISIGLFPIGNMSLFDGGNEIQREFFPLYINISIPMLFALIGYPLLLEKLFLKNDFKKIGLNYGGEHRKFTALIYITTITLLLILFITSNQKEYFMFLSLFTSIQCFGEDILFRGVFQRRLHEYFKPGTSIIIVTVVFVFIFHQDSFLNNLIYRVPLGLAMSYVFYKTKSIFPVFFIHFLNNIYYTIMGN